MAIDIRRHILSLLLVALVATAVYSRVSLAYFCGYDDFLETRRAALVDRVDVEGVFTTTHFNSFKYRPFSRGLSLITYLVHPGGALPFRLRNLAAHALAGAGVYILALLFFESWPAACISALLFVIHPLANQPVAAADWTITTANSIFLFSLIFFLISLRRRSPGFLILSAVCAQIDVLFYESSIMLPVLMTVWWARDSLVNKSLPKLKHVVIFALAYLSLFGSYLLVRHHVVQGARTIISAPLSIVKGLLEYGAALLLPLDLVLLNTWFHFPLPPELLAYGISKGVLVAAAVFLSILICIVLVYRRRIAAGMAQVGWANIGSLLAAMLIAILPFVVFSGHVSETYIYLPVAFFCVFLGRALLLIRPAAARNIVIGFLVLSFGCATWARNERVRACGTEAKRILSTLAAPAFRTGEWRIDVAKTEGTLPSRHFGIYNYHGLDTLGSNDGGIGEYGLQAVEAAVQMASENSAVRVFVHSANELRANCEHRAGNQVCFWVAPDGTVTPF
jgi:hypothetical protein